MVVEGVDVMVGAGVVDEVGTGVVVVLVVVTVVVEEDDVFAVVDISPKLTVES